MSIIMVIVLLVLFVIDTSYSVKPNYGPPKFPTTCASCDGVKCPRLSADHLTCACGLCPVRIPPRVTMPPLLHPMGDADALCKHNLCWCKMRRWSSRPIWCMNANMLHGMMLRARARL